MISGKHSQRLGADAEALVRSALDRAGLRFIQRVETGWRRIGDTWRPAAKVAGDWRAVGPAGVSVLVESKWRGDSLPWSALEPHQHLALDEHAAAGGWSVLAWAGPRRGMVAVRLMSWSNLLAAGFGPGRAIDDAMAERAALHLLGAA